MHRRAFIQSAAAGLLAAPALAGTRLRPIDTQFIAAQAGPDEAAGGNAQDWGLWVQDPGPRGLWLSLYPALAVTGIAPAGWRFDPAAWWLEEHGLIMEAPAFPLPPARYVVTGGRQVTTTLSVAPPDASGAQAWALEGGATIGEVTHLACRAALYSSDGVADCTPAEAPAQRFPLGPGDTMPPVGGCRKRDYAVLFVIGMVEDT
jgi:hypothetical protein